MLDEGITIGELYAILKMGVLRFDLCTRFPEDDADELEVNSKVIQRRSKKDNEKVTEQSEQINETIVVSTDSEGTVADAFSDTSEVMFGPFFGDLLAIQLDDTLPMPVPFAG